MKDLFLYTLGCILCLLFVTAIGEIMMDILQR